MELGPVGMADHGASQKQSSSRPSHLTNLVQWLQQKKYQFEVMMVFYMLTPAERLVLYFIFTTAISMFVATAYFYLPNHLTIISNRVYYYVMGELNHMSSSVGSTASGFSQLVRKTSVDTVTAAVHTAANAAVSSIHYGKEL